MGAASWSSTDWDTHRSATSGKTVKENFKSTTIKDSLNPTKFKFREARDSDVNPESTPIILGSDVTGSMGEMANKIITEDLGKVMERLYAYKPVTNPAICCMAIGDITCDQAPVQATQFESDIRLAEQMRDFYIEGHGGGNDGESYPIAWLFALAKVKADIHKKRGKKGYLFTIGDEAPLETMKREHINQFLDIGAQADMDAKVLYDQVSRDWNIFHLMIKPVLHQRPEERWRKIIGNHLIMLQDLSCLAEVITAAIEYNEGISTDIVVSRYSGDSRKTVIDITSQVSKPLLLN